MRCQQQAVTLGLEAVPAKVEGLRPKAKGLVERGWARQVRPGCSPRSRRRPTAHEHGHRPQSLFTFVSPAGSETGNGVAADGEDGDSETLFNMVTSPSL
jgi:hypothetical protein